MLLNDVFNLLLQAGNSFFQFSNLVILLGSQVFNSGNEFLFQRTANLFLKKSSKSKDFMMITGNLKFKIISRIIIFYHEHGTHSFFVQFADSFFIFLLQIADGLFEFSFHRARLG